jgi:glycosyltransferase involved in cell wall biosynthesis
MIGEVAGEEKNEFLRNAAALLFPIDWPEPFGLVMVEALACGTPVLALRRGSVPEIISDGTTGLVRDTEEELIDAVKLLDRIDRARCREEVERRFSPAAMASAYERVYDELTTAPRSIIDLAGSAVADAEALAGSYAGAP